MKWIQFLSVLGAGLGVGLAVDAATGGSWSLAGAWLTAALWAVSAGFLSLTVEHLRRTLDTSRRIIAAERVEQDDHERDAFHAGYRAGVTAARNDRKDSTP